MVFLCKDKKYKGVILSQIWAFSLFFLLLCSGFVSSCGEEKSSSKLHDAEEDIAEEDINEDQVKQQAYLLPRQDPSCTWANAPSQLGAAVQIWVYDIGRKPTQVQVNMQGFSGKGLSSTLVRGVNIGAHGKSSQSGGELTYSSLGVQLPICQVHGGYELNSQENTGLVLAYVTHQTMHFNRIFDPSSHPNSMQIYLQPLFWKNRTQSILTDNAMHVGQQAELFFLPHSHEYLQPQHKNVPYYHNWMAIGHEITHNLFHNLVLRKKIEENTPTPLFFITAVDEALADLVGHIYWHRPHFTLSKGRNLLSFLTDALLPKRITASTVKLLESKSLDPHVMGGYLAYGFYHLLISGPRKNEVQFQVKMIFHYLYQLRDLSWEADGGDFLAQVIETFGGLLAADQGGLYESQCTVLHKVFPFFVSAGHEKVIQSWGCAVSQ